MRKFVVGVLLSAIGCGGTPTGPDSGDPREAWVIAENDRVAALLRVRVKGVVTDEVYLVPCRSDPRQQCKAAGWYKGGPDHGTAYYWREYLLTKDMAYGTAIATHEVCHAKSQKHDEVHEACISMVGAMR